VKVQILATDEISQKIPKSSIIYYQKIYTSSNLLWFVSISAVEYFPEHCNLHIISWDSRYYSIHQKKHIEIVSKPTSEAQLITFPKFSTDSFADIEQIVSEKSKLKLKYIFILNNPIICSCYEFFTLNYSFDLYLSI
jgi:hypothetical protein